MKLTQARVTWKKKNSLEGLPSQAWPIGMSVNHFLDSKLMEEGLLFTVNLILGHIGKVAEKSRLSSQ